MKRYFEILCVISCFIILGCTKMPYGIIYNNSGVDIEIIAGEKHYYLNRDETAKIIFPQMVRLFIVKHGMKESNYVVRYPPDDYEEHHLTFTIYLLQFESNGNIYVLKPKTIMPVILPYVQPDCFPLKPVVNVKKGGVV